MTDTRPKSIAGLVEIARTPHEVFGYIADATRLPEWQHDVVRAAFDEPEAVAVGVRGREVRRVMGSDRSITWEVSDYIPDERIAIRGVDGPVRAHVTMNVTPSTRGSGTQLRYDIAFEGHGIGKLLALFARSGTRKDLPARLDSLKQRLEKAPA